MNKLLDETKKLSHGHLRELAAMCAGVAILLFAVVFVSGGFGKNVGPLSVLINPSSQTASIFPCSWFGDCPPALIYTQALTPNTGAAIPGISYSTNYTTTGPGQTITLYWQLYGERYGVLCEDGYPCSITADAPRAPSCQNMNFDDSGNFIGGTGFCYTSIGGIAGAYTVSPTKTTTYYLCSDLLDDAGVGCAASTITVPTASPTTLTSFTATPSAVISGSPTTLTWQGAKGTSFSSCELTGGQYGAGTFFTALPGSVTTDPLTADTTYNINCFDTDGTATGWKSATVSVTVPLGSCNDIPSQADVPSGCVNPVPSPGICIPSGGSYSATSNTCSCPTGQHLSGTSCVANPLCSNGLADSYAPSCSCPAGQYQPLGASSCVALPICTNGLSQAYSPTCSCPAGQVQVAGGSTCVLAGVINNLTVSPARVLKGDTATVSWNTSAMSACSLSSLTAAGTSALSSVLTSSLSTGPVTGKTVYTLNCTDASDTTYSSSVTLDLIPVTTEK